MPFQQAQQPRRSRKLESLPANLRAAADELVAAKFPSVYNHTFTVSDTSAPLTAEDLIEAYNSVEPIWTGFDIGHGSDSWVQQLFKQKQRNHSSEDWFKREYMSEWSLIQNVTS